DMRTAAGLQVDGLDFNGAEDALAVDFLSNADLRKLIGGPITHLDGTVVKDNLVWGAVGAFGRFFSGIRFPQIDCASLGAEMEGNCGQSKALLKHGRKQMLAGVLLHVVEAAWPIDAAVHIRTVRPAVEEVNDFVAFLPDIQNVRLT